MIFVYLILVILIVAISLLGNTNTTIEYIRIFLFLLFAVAAISLFYFKYKEIKVVTKIPEKIPTAGLNIPVAGCYEMEKSTAPFAVGGYQQYNNIFPEFVIFEDRFAYRILKSVRCKYSEIEQIDVSGLGPAQMIIFKLKASNTAVGLDLFRKENLKELLEFFKRKKIPFSQKTQKLIED